MNKEQIYDEQIAPLMAKVIEVCRKHKIAHLISFAIPNDDDPDLVCTTANLSKEFDPPEVFVEMFDMINPHGSPVTMINTIDGDGNVTQSTAFLG